MDKFEQMMKDAKGTSPAEMKMDMEKYRSTCKCPTVSDLYYLCQECTRASFLFIRKEFHVHFRAEDMHLSDLPGPTRVLA